MGIIKQKIHNSQDTRTQVHFLTIAPCSWCIAKVQEYFNVKYILCELTKIVAKCISIVVSGPVSRPWTWLGNTGRRHTRRVWP